MNLTVAPVVNAPTTGVGATTYAFADPLSAAYQFGLTSEVPINEGADVAVDPVLLPRKL